MLIQTTLWDKRDKDIIEYLASVFLLGRMRYICCVNGSARLRNVSGIHLYPYVITVFNMIVMGGNCRASVVNSMIMPGIHTGRLNIRLKDKRGFMRLFLLEHCLYLKYRMSRSAHCPD